MLRLVPSGAVKSTSVAFPGVLRSNADEIAFRAVPNHLCATDAAKGSQRGHEINRFENVGLALRVVAEQQMEAGRKIHVHPRVIAEVSESQMSQMHDRILATDGRR